MGKAEGRQPDFRIDFGSSAKWVSGLRLETWQEQLVLVVESPLEADVVLVEEFEDRAGEIFLDVFIDTPRQTILIASQNGNILGELAWKGEFASSFRIQARQPGLHFYSASVAPWDGSSPVPASANQPSVRYKDGKTARGTVSSWDAKSQTWTLVTGSETAEQQPTERRVATSELNTLIFSGAIQQESTTVQALSRNGMRLSGALRAIGSDAIEMRCLGIDEPVALPLATLDSLIFLKKPDSEASWSTDLARLRIGDASILGQLVSGRNEGQSSALVWKSEASKHVSAIANSATGSIVFRERQRPVAKPRSDRVAGNTGFVGGVLRLFSKSRSDARPTSKPARSSQGPTLHLRSGDSIPCEPKRITKEGITFASPVTGATFAPHDDIKALVLVGAYQPARVTQQQRDRLLTLPRIQQDSLPTHLLLSVDGDALRTRVTAMDHQFSLWKSI